MWAKDRQSTDFAEGRWLRDERRGSETPPGAGMAAEHDPRNPLRASVDKMEAQMEWKDEEWRPNEAQDIGEIETSRRSHEAFIRVHGHVHEPSNPGRKKQMLMVVWPYSGEGGMSTNVKKIRFFSPNASRRGYTQ